MGIFEYLKELSCQEVLEYAQKHDVFGIVDDSQDTINAEYKKFTDCREMWKAVYTNLDPKTIDKVFEEGSITAFKAQVVSIVVKTALKRGYSTREQIREIDIRQIIEKVSSDWITSNVLRLQLHNLDAHGGTFTVW